MSVRVCHDGDGVLGFKYWRQLVGRSGLKSPRSLSQILEDRFRQQESVVLSESNFYNSKAGSNMFLV